MVKIAPSILSADFVNLQREMEAVSTAETKPATAIYTVDKNLNALDAEGNAFATVAEVFKAHNYTVLAAFRVSDRETADALRNYLTAIKFYDCFVISADAAVIKDFRAEQHKVSGAIDFTQAYQNATALTEEDCLQIRRTVMLNNGNVAILPASLCTHDTVQYLYHRQILVWAKSADQPTVTEQYRDLLSGAIGVISDASDALLDIACNTLPVNTVTRMPLNIGHRGLPSHLE